LETRGRRALGKTPLAVGDWLSVGKEGMGDTMNTTGSQSRAFGLLPAAHRLPPAAYRLLLPPLLLLLAQCAGGYDKQTQLRNAVDEFHDGFRWGAMGSMISHVRTEDQDAFTADYETRMEGVSIADYETNRIEFSEEGDAADVWVSISWFRADDPELHDAVIREHWVESGSTWNRTEVTVEHGEMP
jgi:hypothetical protein